MGEESGDLATEDPLLALFGMPEGGEAIEPTEDEVSAEFTPTEGEFFAEVPGDTVQETLEVVEAETPEDVTVEDVLETPEDVFAEAVVEPSLDTVTDTTDEPLKDVAPEGEEAFVVGAPEAMEVEVAEVETEVMEPLSIEQETAQSTEEVPMELAFETVVEEPIEVFDTELKSDDDIASAHARLDSMFGAMEPESDPVAQVEDVTVEPSDEFAPETEEPLDTFESILLETEGAGEAFALEVEEESGIEAEVSAEAAPDAPAEELVAEAESAMEPAIESEAEAEVEIDAPAEELVAEAEVEAPVEEMTVEVAPDVPTEVSAEVAAEVGPLVAEAEAAPEPEPEHAPVEVAAVTPEPAQVEVLESVVDEKATERYGSALRRNDTGNVWANRTVPKSKIGGNKLVLTPNVGNVRIIFDGGESIDGRLHAVGTQKIVLDTKLGRMTLDARRADRIDRLGGGKRAELRSPSDSYASTKGLDRVKVRAAGGVFYGYMISQTDEKVTLLLDDGVRVTLNSTEVETAKARKATSRLRSL